MIRIAAMADVHFGPDAAGTLGPHLASLPERADILLLAGDLTRIGDPAEAQVLVEELRGVGVPIVTVLGNHDYHAQRVPEIVSTLVAAGIDVLEGDSITLEIEGCRLGIAGVKGFGGGFVGASASDFGEPEMRAFVQHTKARSARLEMALRDLEACDLRIALLHYAPTPDTLAGERAELYPFLGSYLLAEAIDRAGADLALHGHAHAGSEHGVTAGGVPVRNVAQPVLRRAYAIYCFDDIGKSAPVDLPSPPELAGWRYLAH
ncbi:MAG: metallophosphoesterase [Thermomicrobiales bacterium]|nr:metallophosphoesterase [Thermomicrobiales bacterium]